MPKSTIELNPVTRITADAVGEPGHRTFYVQARKGATLLTLLCEKEQVRALGTAIQQMIDELKTKYPKGAGFMQLQMDMSLEEPITPEYRIGQMGLGYDEEHDLIVLVARELLAEDADEEDASVTKFFCSRAQMDALCRQAAEVVSRGRPVCPLCQKPLDKDLEHFCPRSNGHADEIVFA
ncbi:MAG TPA: DUF3090 domain-containing protein [Anaerolineae bacterium]|jgi:uncharacterized repeat protein (TIGR03847 family)